MEKTCFKCYRTLPITSYYRHQRMADGHLNKCKACTMTDAENHRQRKMKDPEWAAAEAERQRKKNKAMNQEHPLIATARRAVRKLGRSNEYHWHHWSYLKEHHADVFKLRPDDHRKAHRHMVYDPEQFQYRRASTMVLLDTREAHELFLKEFGIPHF